MICDSLWRSRKRYVSSIFRRFQALQANAHNYFSVKGMPCMSNSIFANISSSIMWRVWREAFHRLSVVFLIKWKPRFRRKGSTVLYIWLKIIKFFTRLIETFQHTSRTCVVLLKVKSFTYSSERISTNRCFPFTFFGRIEPLCSSKTWSFQVQFNMDRGWSCGSYSNAGDNYCILSHQVRIPFSLFSFLFFNFSFSSLLVLFFLQNIKRCCSLPHVRISKTVLDSGFQAVESGLQVLDSSLCQWNLDSGFQSLVWFGILSCIPDSKAQDSGFHKQSFPWLRIPEEKISWIPESKFPYKGQRVQKLIGFGLKQKTKNKKDWK